MTTSSAMSALLWDKTQPDNKQCLDLNFDKPFKI